MLRLTPTLLLLSSCLCAQQSGIDGIAIDLTSGPYRLIATGQSLTAPRQSALVDVHASNADTPVNVALAPGEALSGTLEFEGDPPKNTRSAFPGKRPTSSRCASVRR